MTQSWSYKTIGDVCEIVNGATPKTGTSAFWDGPHQWATPAEMGKRLTPYLDETSRSLTAAGLDSCSASPVPPHSVIMSSRAPIGHLVINTVPMSFNQGCKGLVPRPELDHKFLYYYLFSKVAHLNELGTGATFKELSAGSLKRVEIPVPPFPEQQRIVGILDQAFEKFAKANANAKRNVANAKEFLTNGFDELISVRCEDAPLASLDGIADFKNGLNFTRSSKGEVIKIVGVADFKSNFWTPYDLDEVQIEGSLSEAYELRDGDILVVRSNGNKELIGRCILARGTKGKTSHSGFTIRVRPVSEGIDPEYLTHFMKSSAVRRSLVASGDGANISSLNQKALSSVVVPIPPVSVQREIVNDLSALGEKISQLTASMTQKLSMVGELQRSMLHQAFSGKL